MVNAKQRDKKATTLSVFVLMIKVGGARMCLRFMAFLIISQICVGGGSLIERTVSPNYILLIERSHSSLK